MSELRIPAQLEEVIAQVKGARIGRALRKIGKVTREQVHEALTLQQGEKKGMRTGEILVELGYITEKDVLEGLAAQRGFGFIDLAGLEIPDEVLGALTPQTAKAYGIIPLEYDAATRSIKVALRSPDNSLAIDDLRQLFRFSRVSAVVALAEQIDAILSTRYQSGGADISSQAAAAAQSAALAGL